MSRLLTGCYVPAQTETVKHEASWLELALVTSVALVVVSMVGQYCLCMTEPILAVLHQSAAADLPLQMPSLHVYCAASSCQLRAS